MKPVSRMLLRAVMGAVLSAGWVSQVAFGQTVTTGSLVGTVADEQSAVLPGASVLAVFEPTGGRSEAVTEADGHFVILNLQVGGPYTVTAKLPGFKDQAQSGISVGLGESKTVNFKLQLQAVTEQVTVVGATPEIDTTRAGTAENVSQEAIASLPTISRGIADFARISPFFNTNAADAGSNIISVAGRNNRYNNIQIDGAVNNDVFGLADAGTPGGRTQTQPISLDAIQELQLVVSPYDVRQGGFSGGSVNAITKSGTNAFHGTGYYFGRNQNWVGKGIDDREYGRFTDKQSGATLGGPIVRNKAFFFANVDFGRKNQPSGFSINGSGQRFGHEAEAQRFRDILRTKYNYDPGGLDEFTQLINNDKVFVRGDINISDKHRLTVRHNYINADFNSGFPTRTLYLFPDNFTIENSKTNSTVGQLNSTFGHAVNEARITYQRIRDLRGGPTRFPAVTVRLPDASSLRAGRENSSTANELDQDVIEVTDDMTMVRGGHTFTVGTHNEFFKFRDLFIQNTFGTYEFANLDNFEAGIAGGFNFGLALVPDLDTVTRFSVRQWGFYAGDQWRVKSNLTLTYGVRLDFPVFPKKPTRNPVTETLFGFRTDVAPAPKMWSPRVGFNYDVTGDATQQIRGGVALFSGRTPYVWLYNQYGNTGIEFRRLSVTFNAANTITFVPNPDAQPTNVGGAQINEVDMVDPDYEYPQIIRGNLAYDRDLGFGGLKASAELVYTTNVKEIAYKNLNLVQTGTRPDGRPVFARVTSSLSDVILLTNTDKGDSWTLAFKVDRPFRNGWYASGSYLYGEANAVNDGTSSTARSNWGNVWNPGDINNPPVSPGRFRVGHRINLSGAYQVNLPADYNVTFSMFYNGQSGRPYATLFSSSADVNGDNFFGNDLFYVPRTPDEVVVTNGTADDLEAYINGDKVLSENRGKIVERNGGRVPFTNSFDFRTAVHVPAGKANVEVTFDLLNLINLFDSSKGQVLYADFNRVQPVTFGGIDAATGKMIYNISPLKSSTFTKFLRDDLRSRWQAQLGARIRF